MICAMVMGKVLDIEDMSCCKKIIKIKILLFTKALELYSSRTKSQYN